MKVVKRVLHVLWLFIEWLFRTIFWICFITLYTVSIVITVSIHKDREAHVSIVTAQRELQMYKDQMSSLEDENERLIVQQEEASNDITSAIEYKQQVEDLKARVAQLEAVIDDIEIRTGERILAEIDDSSLDDVEESIVKLGAYTVSCKGLSDVQIDNIRNGAERINGISITSTNSISINTIIGPYDEDGGYKE